MYAVFMSGGKQYRVQSGGMLRLEKLAMEEGATVEFDKVLLVGEGENVAVGSPYVEGGRVLGKVKSHGKGKKIRVIKFKRRKGYRRTLGHRQVYTEVEITNIEGGPADAPPASEGE